MTPPSDLHTPVHHIVIYGSGTLSRSICESLASLGSAEPLRVTVLARNQAAVRAIVEDCANPAIPFESRILTSSIDDEVEALATLRPDVLVCCASSQSPYERVSAPSAWTRLIEAAGFGLTLPLQTVVVARLARAIAAVSERTLLINGCFPDAVNPLLASLGLPVWCGIGNVATLATCLQAALRLPDQQRLAALGHHAQLAAPAGPKEEMLVWHDDEPLTGVTELLAADRARPRRELNEVAGRSAARLLLDLVSSGEFSTNLPGPLGLPGGYPVRVVGREISLNLPSGVSRDEAIDWNITAGHRDGIEVADGRVSYLPRAAAALEQHLPDLAEGWAAQELDDVRDQLCAVRTRLRLAQPSLI